MESNKQQACDAMKAYAEELARNYGLNCVEEKQNTFWSDLGSPVYIYTDGKSKEVKIEYRMRFGSPRIDFHNGQDFASVELGQGYRPTGEKDKYGHDKYEHDGIYRPNETQTWGEGGLAMLNIMWQELSHLIHEPSNEFYE